MAIFTNIVPTTELEALNSMLASIGEAPYDLAADFSGGTSADAAMAIGILRDKLREVQSMGWKFNTEFGYEIAPTGTYSWVDTDGVTTLLNIFLPPANLSGFSITPICEQQGSREIDTEIRKSRKFTTGSPAAAVRVFYDRRRARDGFPATEHPFLYINPIWLFDFDDLPQVARAYILYTAGRKFQASVVGSTTLYKFTEDEERIALRNLKREQGTEDDYNLLQTGEVSRARGGRPGGWSGFTDIRKNRNSV